MLYVYIVHKALIFLCVDVMIKTGSKATLITSCNLSEWFGPKRLLKIQRVINYFERNDPKQQASHTHKLTHTVVSSAMLLGRDSSATACVLVTVHNIYSSATHWSLHLGFWNLAWPMELPQVLDHNALNVSKGTLWPTATTRQRLDGGSWQDFTSSCLCSWLGQRLICCWQSGCVCFPKKRSEFGAAEMTSVHTHKKKSEMFPPFNDLHLVLLIDYEAWPIFLWELLDPEMTAHSFPWRPVRSIL